MSIEIDQSGRFETAAQRIELIRAVVAAEPEDEAHWIEWKGSLDLTTKEHRFKVAKAILASANRMPDRARDWADGYAYLIVGAEPGALDGVGPIDLADVEAKIRPWVGGGESAPRWTPAWVTVDQKRVLVVEIEPPLAGDPIFPLRQRFNTIHNGTVFVRRQASSNPADDQEVLHLSERAAGQRQVNVAVDAATDDPMLGLRIDEEEIEVFITAKREYHLKPLVDEVRRREIERQGAIQVNPIGGVAMQGVRDLFASSTLSALSAYMAPTEKRSPSDFEAEVEDYLARYREVVPNALLCRWLQSESATVRLRLTNPTDMNVPGVRVTAHLPVGFVGLDSHNELTLPEPPRPFGYDSSLVLHQTLAGIGRPHLPFLATLPQNEVISYRSDTAGLDIRWPRVDLAPFEDLELEPAPIAFISTGTANNVGVEWKATSSGFNGVATGSLHLPLSDRPLRIEDLIDLEDE